MSNEARERLQAILDAWGGNHLVPVRTDDLRALLTEDRSAYAEGWNDAARAFGGVEIVDMNRLELRHHGLRRRPE